MRSHLSRSSLVLDLAALQVDAETLEHSTEAGVEDGEDKQLVALVLLALGLLVYLAQRLAAYLALLGGEGVAEDDLGDGGIALGDEEVVDVGAAGAAAGVVKRELRALGLDEVACAAPILHGLFELGAGGIRTSRQTGSSRRNRRACR